MDQLADRLIEFVSSQNNPIGLAILGLSALVEYIFPPFPGDTITLFAAFLITAKGWSFAGVFGSILAGSGAGSMLAFFFGRWVEKRRLARTPRHPERREKLDRLIARFERHGEAYLVLNRFIPALRALFFVAAGMAGMRPGFVLLWSVISAALWNLLLIALGSAVGANFEELKAFFFTYSRLVWLALVAGAVLWLGFVIVRRLRRPPPP